MRNTAQSLAVAVTVAIATVACNATKPSPSPVSADVRVGQEIARLDTALRKLEAAQLPAGLVDLRRGARATLDRASKSRTASVRLYRLRDADVGIETLRFLASHPDSGRNLQSVTTLWNEQRPLFTSASTLTHGTALERALAEGAGNRASKLFVASLPYAKASSPGDGLYYLAEAEGNRQYRLFVESLAAGDRSAEATPRRDVMDAAMASLDAETSSAFEKDPTGFGAVNPSARLKEAHELADQNLLDGAVLKLMEARLMLGHARASTQQASAASSAVPASIRALLDGVAADSPEKGALIRSEVLPLYASHAVVTAAVHPRPDVTVTLVRWPYT